MKKIQKEIPDYQSCPQGAQLGAEENMPLCRNSSNNTKKIYREVTQNVFYCHVTKLTTSSQ